MLGQLTTQLSIWGEGRTRAQTRCATEGVHRRVVRNGRNGRIA